MRHPVLLLALLGLCSATPALAGSIVLRSGEGRDCYVATLMTPSPSHDARALAACEQAVRAYPDKSYDRAASLINRSEILIRLGRFADAAADSEQGIAIEPGLGAGHLNRGAAMIGMERYDEAQVSVERAISLGIDKMELAYYDRALVRESKGDIKGAYLDFRKATELAPNFRLASEQLARFTVKRVNP